MALIPLSTVFTRALAYPWIDNQLTHYPRFQANRTHYVNQLTHSQVGGPKTNQDPQRPRAGSTNSLLLDAGQNVNLEKGVP